VIQSGLEPDTAWRNELTGGMSTLLEWDAKIPPFEVVHAEVLKSQKLHGSELFPEPFAGPADAPLDDGRAVFSSVGARRCRGSRLTRVVASRQQHVSRLGSGEDLQMNSILRTASHWHATFMFASCRGCSTPSCSFADCIGAACSSPTGVRQADSLALTAQRFTDWHIPAPIRMPLQPVRRMLCGAMLVLGVASRFVTVPLIVTMIVAYRTAHIDEVTDLYTFCHRAAVSAPVRLHARAAVRAGSVLDRLSNRQIHLGLILPPKVEPGCKLCIEDFQHFATKPSKRSTVMTSASRRQFNQLALAALGGAVTGSVLGLFARRNGQSPWNRRPPTALTNPRPQRPPKTYDENLLLVGDPHVCRGLNQCKNQGKTHMNECAGQGACATAEKHGCDGLNTCKGQGGCGEHPGQNQCKGQGACAVTLKDATWQKARAKFEELMAAKNKKDRRGPRKRLITMSSPAFDLATIQAWMQSVIMNRAGVIDGIASVDARSHIDVSPAQIESVIERSSQQTSVERLEIYSGAYYARLLECLRAEYPIMAEAMGKELFDEFAVEYLPTTSHLTAIR